MFPKELFLQRVLSTALSPRWVWVSSLPQGINGEEENVVCGLCSTISQMLTFVGSCEHPKSHTR